MNHEGTLSGLRADVLPISPQARRRGRALLATSIERASATVPAPHVGRWRGWRLVGPSAALTAAAVVAIVAGPPDRPDNTTTQPAREVLILAAGSVAQDAVEPRPDQFLYWEVVQFPSYGAIENYRWDLQIWESVDGTRLGEVRETSPEACGAQVSEGRCTTSHEHRANGDEDLLYYAPYTVLATLPTDPEQLLATLEAAADGDVELWQLITNLLERGPAPQRAALLRGVATIPDIELLDGLTDAAGRPGVGVGLVNPMVGGLDVVIFDRSTFEYLGSRVIHEDGRIEFDRAVIRTGIVDEVGQLPE